MIRLSLTPVILNLTLVIKVYIIEDQLVLVLGLQFFLKQPECSCTVTGYSTSVKTAIGEIQNNPCDVMIMDLFIDRTDPLVHLRRIRTLLPDIPIIVYSSESSLLWRWRVLKEGVMGFVIKNSGIDELLPVIHGAVKGETTVPQDLRNFFDKMNFADGLNAINTEDLDIIRFKDLGYKNTNIADILHLSVKAIEKRLQRLCNKFEVETVKDLIRLLVNPSVFGRKIY